MTESVPVQTDLFSSAYPIEKEGELLSAISKGDIHTANARFLGISSGQIMLHNVGNIEVLRSRVVELTVPLSRPPSRARADINAILGLNYDYLRRLTALSSIEDIVLWLYTVTRRFTQHVLIFPARSIWIPFIRPWITSSAITLQTLASGNSGPSVYEQQYFCLYFQEERARPRGLYHLRPGGGKQSCCASVGIIDIPGLGL